MRFADWARSQMEYIMGKNPMDRSYIVGYAENSAKNPHHRAAHGSTTYSMDDPPVQVHVLWGALVGGPDEKDYHLDITKDYIYNELQLTIMLDLQVLVRVYITTMAKSWDSLWRTSS